MRIRAWFNRSILFIALSLFYSISHAVLYEYTYKLEEKLYSVYVLDGLNEWDYPVTPDREIEYKLRKAGVELQVETYEKAGYPIYASIENMMLTSRRMVAVTEHKNPNNILHMMSVYNTDFDSHELPGIKMMKANGLDPNIQLDEMTVEPDVFLHLPKTGKTSKHSMETNYSQGGTHSYDPPQLSSPHPRAAPRTVARRGAAELGAFVRSDQSRGFFPLIMRLMVAHNLILDARFYPSYVAPSDKIMSPAEIKQFTSTDGVLILPEGYKKLPPPPPHSTGQVRHIIGVTFSPKIVSYLENLGFEKWREGTPPKHPDKTLYLMGIDSKDLAHQGYFKAISIRDGETIENGFLKYERALAPYNPEPKETPMPAIIPREKLSTPPTAESCSALFLQYKAGPGLHPNYIYRGSR